MIGGILIHHHEGFGPPGSVPGGDGLGREIRSLQGQEQGLGGRTHTAQMYSISGSEAMVQSLCFKREWGFWRDLLVF
jgi:hypothetical protein